MRNFICWKPQEVYRVVNTDADTVASSVFWAVDSDTPVALGEGETGDRRQVATDILIERFLDPDRKWARMAVLGPSGAGKSHLIRRLHNRLRRRDGLKVVLVQRMQTNLRAILELLIAEAPVEAQARYREDLEQAGHVLTTPHAQKNALLDGLAQAIEEDLPDAESGLDPEEEAFLLEFLPHLFRDPHLREAKWLRDGEVVPELVDRQFSDRGGKRIDEELLFDAASLPSDGISLQDCAAPARDAINYYLYDSGRTTPSVLAVINRNLPRAIQRMLNFSGEKLVDLLSDIRRGLARENKELVLLFEEFARLQGYDRAMLEALLDEGDPDGPAENRPCRLRWALACTTGRFESLEATVRRRIDFIVDMDVPTVDQDLPGFTGRYLNAVRWGEAALATAQQDGAGVPNFCEDCPFKSPCHAAFGQSSDGFGLYPLTAGALSVMSARKGLDKEGRSNPRLLQRYVLHPLLADEGRLLAEDAFPSRSLLDRMGGPQMSATDRQRLRDRAGPRFERYLALFELWSEGRFTNPPPGVATAFGLDDLTGLDSASTPVPSSHAAEPEDGQTATERAGVAAEPGAGTRPIASREQQQISAWVDGGPLDQSLSNNLRNWLFDAVDNAIDWDDAKLTPAIFASATSVGGLRPFTRTSISFANQGTSGATIGGKAAVQLSLPLRQDEKGFADTAAALERLVQFQRTKNWDQSGGLEGLAAVSELVRACADDVVLQIRNLRDAGDGWDPVEGAIELLLCGAALGAVLPSAPTDEDLVTALFAPIPQDSANFEAPLRSIYELLRDRRAELIRLVRAHASASKGGRQGRFVDPRVLEPASRRFRRGKWMLTRDPQPRSTPYRDIESWYAKVKQDLPLALAAEQARRQEWLAELEHNLGDVSVRKAAILKAVGDALDATAQAGLPVSRRALDDALAAFAPLQYDAAVQAARTIAAASPPQSELAAFGRGARAGAVTASRALVGAWSAFLASAEAEAAARRAEQGSSLLEDELLGLDTVLGELLGELSQIEAIHEPA